MPLPTSSDSARAETAWSPVSDLFVPARPPEPPSGSYSHRLRHHSCRVDLGNSDTKGVDTPSDFSPDSPRSPTGPCLRHVCERVTCSVLCPSIHRSRRKMSILSSPRSSLERTPVRRKSPFRREGPGPLGTIDERSVDNRGKPL